MTTPRPAELTEAERVRLREDHGRRAGWEGRMCECGQRAPCATLRLLDALEAAERIAEAARKWGELNRAAAVEQSDRASEEAGKALDYLERLMAAERRVTAHMERAEKAERLLFAKQREYRELREGIEALAGSWEHLARNGPATYAEIRRAHAADIRALLSTSSVRGEDGVSDLPMRTGNVGPNNPSVRGEGDG